MEVDAPFDKSIRLLGGVGWRCCFSGPHRPAPLQAPGGHARPDACSPILIRAAICGDRFRHLSPQPPSRAFGGEGSMATGGAGGATEKSDPLQRAAERNDRSGAPWVDARALDSLAGPLFCLVLALSPHATGKDEAHGLALTSAAFGASAREGAV